MHPATYRRGAAAIARRHRSVVATANRTHPPAMPYDTALADRVTRVFTARRVPFETKAMMGGLCFMVDGKMCVGVEKDRLMVRLDPAVEAAALARPGCQPMELTPSLPPLGRASPNAAHCLPAFWNEEVAGYLRCAPVVSHAPACSAHRPPHERLRLRPPRGPRNRRATPPLARPRPRLQPPRQSLEEAPRRLRLKRVSETASCVG